YLSMLPLPVFVQLRFICAAILTHWVGTPCPLTPPRSLPCVPSASSFLSPFLPLPCPPMPARFPSRAAAKCAPHQTWPPSIPASCRRARRRARLSTPTPPR